MENDEKILSSQDCRVSFFHNRYSVLATSHDKVSEAKNVQRWLKKLEDILNNNEIMNNVENIFEEIGEDLSPKNLCAGEYNMSSMLDALKTEISVLSKDYKDTLDELNEIADAYRAAAEESLEKYRTYRRQQLLRIGKPANFL